MKENTSNGGLESFWESLQERGLSAGVAELISIAWRPGTQSAYASSWQQWSGWCIEQEIDPLQAPVADVVEFLKDMLEKGYSYSTIIGFK